MKFLSVFAAIAAVSLSSVTAQEDEVSLVSFSS